MEGTWGRRVFGTVVKGPKNTRFRLAVKLENDLVIYQVAIIPNNELAQFDGLYKFTLDKMVVKLQERIDERAQSWARG